MAVAMKTRGKRETPRPRAQDLDRHIGERIRQRRVMLGLSQQQMADIIGVTYQQAHKYEKGINRIAGGRLYQVAQALGVEVGYFYEGVAEDGAVTVKNAPHQRLLLELTRHFTSLTNRKHQEAICNLARALANHGNGDDANFAGTVSANAA